MLDRGIRDLHSQIDVTVGFEGVSDDVRTILIHLCGGEERCRAFGFVVEWCEARGDCAYTVLCPGCSHQFVVSEDELAELRRWTDAEGNALVCGVRWDWD